MNEEAQNHKSGDSSSDWMSNIPRPTISSPTPPPPVVPAVERAVKIDERSPEEIRITNELKEEEPGELYKQAKTVFYTGYATAIPFIGLLLAFLCWKRTRPWNELVNEHEFNPTSVMVKAAVRSSWAWFLFSCIALFLGLTSMPFPYSLLVLAIVQIVTAVVALGMTYVMAFLSRVMMDEHIGVYDAGVVAIRMVTGCVVLFLLSLTLFRGNIFYLAFGEILCWIVAVLSVLSVLDLGKTGSDLGWRVIFFISCSASLLWLMVHGVFGVLFYLYK